MLFFLLSIRRSVMGSQFQAQFNWAFWALSFIYSRPNKTSSWQKKKKKILKKEKTSLKEEYLHEDFWILRSFQ